jgi:hypothetical protein
VERERGDLRRERGQREEALAPRRGRHAAIGPQRREIRRRDMTLDRVVNAALAGLGRIQTAVGIALEASDRAGDQGRCSRAEQDTARNRFTQHALHEIGRRLRASDADAEIHGAGQELAGRGRDRPLASVEGVEGKAAPVGALG